MAEPNWEMHLSKRSNFVFRREVGYNPLDAVVRYLLNSNEHCTLKTNLTNNQHIFFTATLL